MSEVKRILDAWDKPAEEPAAPASQTATEQITRQCRIMQENEVRMLYDQHKAEAQEKIQNEFHQKAEHLRRLFGMDFDGEHKEQYGGKMHLSNGMMQLIAEAEIRRRDRQMIAEIEKKQREFWRKRDPPPEGQMEPEVERYKKHIEARAITEGWNERLRSTDLYKSFVDKTARAIRAKALDQMDVAAALQEQARLMYDQLKHWHEQDGGWNKAKARDGEGSKTQAQARIVPGTELQALPSPEQAQSSLNHLREKEAKEARRKARRGR